MNSIELLDIISGNETSAVQFKEKIDSPDAFAAEMTAFSNSDGGIIIIGVKDKIGEIIGLSADQFDKTQNLAANVAHNNIIPPIYIKTESVKIEEKNILVIHIKEDIHKPYKDKNNAIWIKQGADKRRVTDNNELLRLFQSGTNFSADEMDVYDTSIDDIDKDRFESYFKKEVDKTIEEAGLTFEKALILKKALHNNRLTLAGLLFFGKEPQKFKPAFCVKAVSFFGNEIGSKEYRNKPRDIGGVIPDIFEKGMTFFMSNLKHIQKSEDFNTRGVLEISEIALKELLINALVHRDYFKNAPIRLMIFDNRIEIISPGKLPNSLTVEAIKYGNPVVRNNRILAYSLQILSFSGFGTGIIRALSNQPDIEFINDTEGEQFIIKIPRIKKKA
ncbi:MAG: putative DNA binding domain-containing protein [Deltaproteobacteria bacterium]|nr:putative DNA binding domain-containing protein [Deltaproteobacteria bacterium]